MIQQGLYLRIVEGGQTFLMPTDEITTIERRDRMQVDEDKNGIVGWFSQGSDRWPAYRLGTLLDLDVGAWEHAIFFKTLGRPLGIAAELMQLLPHQRDVQVRPFHVIGNRLSGESVFNGVWINAPTPALMISGQQLMTRLSQRRGNR